MCCARMKACMCSLSARATCKNMYLGCNEKQGNVEPTKKGRLRSCFASTLADFVMSGLLVFCCDKANPEDTQSRNVDARHGMHVRIHCGSHRRRSFWLSTLPNKKFHFSWARVSRFLPSPPLFHPSFIIARWTGRVVLANERVYIEIDSAFVVHHVVLSCSPSAPGEFVFASRGSVRPVLFQPPPPT